ncbi:MAG: FdhF/YdeP family oxidoreductase [Myxococcales bacterium]|nr:FdhF/YdeP family oxidoreductase [Myxococcales bacterium]
MHDPDQRPPADRRPTRRDVATEPYDHAAGGAGAIASVGRELWRHTGIVRGAKLLLQVNQADGFDCPGCAWPDPPADERTRFEFCENGAKAVAAEGTKRRVGPDFFAQWSVADLEAQSDHWLEAQGRLTHPMVRRPGATHYAPIAWDEAFALVGDALRDLDSPDEAVFYTSGRTSNEAAFLYQLFARQFGTNNLPDCSNMCHESSGRGLGWSIGVGKGTVGLEDFDRADAIFVIGQNPGTNHPRMLTTLERAAKRGCAIVSVNPMLEKGLVRFAHPQKPLAILGQSTPLCTLHLPVRINGDVALLKGLMKVVLEREAAAPGTVLDHDFIAEHTEGFEAFRAALEATPWAPLLEQSGLSREQIEQAADLYCRSEATIVCWAMGLTQHKNGVGNVREVVNLLLLRGNLGRPGAGACPVRGHSNVQGDRTVGIVERPKPAFLERLGARFDFTPPAEHGLDVVESIHALHDGRAKVFVGMGGNFVAATPDTDYTAEALRCARLTVQVSTRLNRSHLIGGDTMLILPCLGRTEEDVQAGGPQLVSVENSMSIVSQSRGRRPPASDQLRSEPAIVAGLAKATLGDRSTVDWDHLVADYDRVRDAIEAVVPGFDDYNARVRVPGGFLLPNGARDRVWRTAVGKARFSVNRLPEIDLAPGQYLMMTVRSHDQYNTTVYGLDDRYRGIYGARRVVMMDPADITAAGLDEGRVVDLVSHFRGEERVAPGFAVVAQSLPRGCVATYFPEANVLVPARHVADESNTPASKSVVVTLRPA